MQGRDTGAAWQGAAYAFRIRKKRESAEKKHFLFFCGCCSIGLCTNRLLITALTEGRFKKAAYHLIILKYDDII